ncbi:MAG: carbohydrate kinase family protein [bacterium]|nr:carbohydrate kinase family protein [bacterium]
MKYDMLSLGPARMDVFIALPEDEINQVCSVDKERCMIELGFGEKIAVRGMTFAIGGNTGNNAVGLSRLGLKVAMAGTMGGEWTDKQALEILKSEGVETKYIKVEPGKFGFGVVINYQGERTILSYYPESTNEFPADPSLDAKWIYLTTVGADFETFYHQAVDWAVAHQAKIGFNPGTRQLKAGKDAMQFAFSQTEVVFLNKEETAKLLDFPLDDIKKLLDGLRGLGPKMAVITDGPAGTYCSDGQKYWFMPIIDAPVVERTGAGDAFGSGFLAAYIQGQPIDQCLKWGTVNSASVLGFIGPQAGLLHPQQIEEWLKKAANVAVKEL